ncbi:hypothetical protein MtrunA17_Chr6g0462851 [Medicago truncatula]|uniref:Transmembrane protein, putative n=1 Tax=Medicago truncatula TaxID=3880 RepID=A0A072U7L7_MEDTR|nr:transmembrane protein, putative [Medicago truncatula]RHN50925.1 hypothetical protein MtrunA17_Chr6g0462851 [Medicago truncatula]
MINRHTKTNTNTTPYTVFYCSLIPFLFSSFLTHPLPLSLLLSHLPVLCHSPATSLSPSSFSGGVKEITVYVVIEGITMGEGPGSESDPNKGVPLNFDPNCSGGVKVVQEYRSEGQ